MAYNETERKLTITILDHRSEKARKGKKARRERQYTDFKEYLQDMGRLMRSSGVKLRETTDTMVEIYPLREKELFDPPKP